LHLRLHGVDRERALIHGRGLRGLAGVLVNLSKVCHGDGILRLDLQGVAQFAFGIGKVAHLALHPRHFNVRAGNVRLRFTPGLHELQRFALASLFVERLRQRVVRRLVHRIDGEVMPQHALGSADVAQPLHAHGQVVAIVSVVGGFGDSEGELVPGHRIIALLVIAHAGVVHHPAASSTAGGNDRESAQQAGGAKPLGHARESKHHSTLLGMAQTHAASDRRGASGLRRDRSSCVLSGRGGTIVFPAGASKAA
jgi:hypothetical protein